jgi:hypothetical protein
MTELINSSIPNRVIDQSDPIYSVLRAQLPNDFISRQNYIDNLNEIISKFGDYMSKTNIKIGCCNNKNYNARRELKPEEINSLPENSYKRRFNFTEENITIPDDLCISMYDNEYCNKFNKIYCANMFYNFNEQLTTKFNKKFDTSTFSDWVGYRPFECRNYDIGKIPRVDLGIMTENMCNAKNEKNPGHNFDRINNRCYAPCPDVFAPLQPNEYSWDITNKRYCKRVENIPIRPDINVVNTTSTSIHLNISKVANADYYLLTINNNQIKIDHNENLGMYLMKNITDLIPGTEYTITIQAFNTYGTSGINLIKAVTTPATISKIVGSNIKSDSATLSWNIMPNTTNYFLFKDNKLERQFDNISSTYTIRDLLPNTEYKFNMNTRNYAGLSDNSELTIIKTAPKEPTNLKPINISSNKIEITWETSPGAVNYIIDYKSETDTISKEIISLENKKLITELLENTKYQFKIKAINNQLAESYYSQSIEILTAPKSPASIMPGKIEPTTAEITFQPAIGAVKYKILYIDEKEVTKEEIFDTQPYIIKNLTPNTKYKACIKSINNLNSEGEYSNFFEFITDIVLIEETQIEKEESTSYLIWIIVGIVILLIISIAIFFIINKKKNKN